MRIQVQQMQKLRVKIKGSKVHDVGYRVLLVNKALSFGISNFNVFNTYIDSVQTVIAIIEADDEIIDEFKTLLLLSGLKSHYRKYLF